MAALPPLGRKIRAVRSRERLTQSAMAKRLGISPSYLNLIENDRRPVTAALLVRLAHEFGLDIGALAAGGDPGLDADLMEVFGDPLFDETPVTPRDVRELVAASPELARAIVKLHGAWRHARASAETLAESVLDREDLSRFDRTRVSSEQVSDLLERHRNHFPELEEAAERVWRDGRLDEHDLFASLTGYLHRAHGITVDVRTVGEMGAALRRFDPTRKLLLLSEGLRRGSRNFQLAQQIGLVAAAPALDHYAADPQLASDEARALARVALASYFAAAVLMPYAPFLRAAEQERYDVDLLGHRFRATWEQICHRLTTLRRPGAEGVPFYMVRVDLGGNISKKLGGTETIRFPRFGGLCPLWNVHAAFLQPGQVRTQLSRFPDGRVMFSVARTVRRQYGGFHAPATLHAISIGCPIDFAPRLVYADGVDLGAEHVGVPVGTTCRLCPRLDCQARAFPPIQTPLRVDENVRGVSFYAPV